MAEPTEQLSDGEVAVAAVQAGAAVARAGYRTSLQRFDKGGGDFATAADLDAEAAIVGVIRAARPLDATDGEETGRAGSAAARRTWLIDPICGTRNYAAGTGPVAVNVALRIDAAVSACAVADPIADEVFWAAEGAAWLRRDGAVHRLEPSSASRLVDINLDDWPYPDGRPYWPAALLTDPRFRGAFETRVASSTLATAWVAAGRRAAYLTSGDLRGNVHFAASIGLCIAAGCAVTDLAGGEVHRGVGGLIAAADVETNRRLVEILAPHLP